MASPTAGGIECPLPKDDAVVVTSSAPGTLVVAFADPSGSRSGGIGASSLVADYGTPVTIDSHLLYAGGACDHRPERLRREHASNQIAVVAP